MKRGVPLKRTRMKKAPRKKGPMPEDVRENVLARDGGCVAHRMGFALDVVCSGRWHVHHVILRSQGGPDTEDNLLTVCESHHHIAHDVRRGEAEACGIIRRSHERTTE